MAITPDEAAAFVRDALKRDHYATLIVLTQRQLELSPDEPSHLFHHAIALFGCKRFTEAQQIFERLLREQLSQHEAIHLWLGRLHEESGDLRKAIEHYEFSCTKPRDTSPLILLGHVLLRLGRLQDAMNCALRATTLKGDQDEAHLLVAQIHLASGDAVSAIRALNNPLENNPSYVEAQHLLADVQQSQQLRESFST